MNDRKSFWTTTYGILVAIAGILGSVATILATLNQYGVFLPRDMCQQGYVWRQAIPTDHVCVPPQVHDQTAYDNGQANVRRDPKGGPYGRDQCLYPYVWRGAFDGDHVCVTPETRDQAASDNSQAAVRLRH